jgi:phosphoadenosine phosphosulfate reductase
LLSSDWGISERMVVECEDCGHLNPGKHMIRYREKIICKECICSRFSAKGLWTRVEISEILRHKNVFALFSGGKDSLCALTYVKSIIDDMNPQPLLIALHADTTISLPQVIPYIQSVCKILNIPLVILRPEKSFATLAKEWGLPSIWKRWCCRELKIKPIQKYLRLFRRRIVFDGIRAEESYKRAKYKPIFWHRGFKCFSISPIFYWTTEEVDQYLSSRDLPINPVYKTMGFSGECVCGAYLREEHFINLKLHHPKFFQKLAKIEESIQTGYTFIFRDGKRIKLSELKS